MGEATNANTRYQENRPAPLPSGLGTFSVRATVDLTRPPRAGPFVPEIPYLGDLTDAPSVEAWMLAQVGKRQARADIGTDHIHLVDRH